MRSAFERCFMELFVGAVKVRDKCQAECILAVIYIRFSSCVRGVSPSIMP